MTLPASYFDDLYISSPDPWSLADRWYEQRKYALTMASLPKSRFARAFEPGCSVGVLTSMLASRCDELVATDIADQAVATTRERVGPQSGVTITQMTVPDNWPAGDFDLIVLSEVGYYFSPTTLGALVDRTVGSLRPGGALVAVHWRHPVEDYPLTGDEVHEVLRADPRLVAMATHKEPDFLLDVRVKPPLVSVAEAEGLVGAANGGDRA